MKSSLLTAAIILALGASSTMALESAATYRCGDVAGVQLTAPQWQAQAESVGEATVLLNYAGNGLQGSVRWSSSPHEYAAYGFAMKAGFTLVLIADAFIETYVVNEANREVLITMARSGDIGVPNSSKAFRGTCQPAG